MRTTRKGDALAQLLCDEGISNQKVLNAIASVPRERFLPDALQHKAYQNTALPIGQGQTISQPYIVAKMSELLLAAPNSASSVLEIGTGSGYQTAILALLFPQVFSVERIKALQFQAKRRMNQLDLHNIKMKHGDGWQGWSSKAPYDCIIVTAAASSVPEALTDQLNEGGRLVIPVGDDQQQLLCIDKIEGELHSTTVEAVRFVPLVAGDLL
ncbi:MAG: protein-L-isoaspartate(D-aspartate) O-methyltransferase [Pseudomonadota bacterium]|uniref:Protein-L-isoaspartate O-methyltransferase n=1 Tax=Alteromonas alba TaxID=2079529 RepID=A0A2S9V765_9ALTE|nr:protein-L-isoaspartate(D-aspartate) O-methyltransferase [Alteromonas alba]MAJ70750.1 protein-L-isoaspartate O-methyltransferase [Alteromonadaceae bacterium]MCP4865351.1 protein-L-isoaspartate(D-aspartate) O-methyltransferase [Alteromonas sp.]MDY6927750.1 protein-L-isoaspartate(D-aspartate) O-methyltransferase [Pseudomonadota bacterium]RPH19401.1 MAG: protein-L-isoaspartate(D-aspartate) O-methyltransferase [Alteromonadaceae bacterium TMED7]PRO72273.1 protein-L-isoaspartate O-methyltransferas|tara:strand:+ start:985 stop:1620 length:636 start_codon:yes stop_codon:yes gene_type:complete